MVDCLGHSKLGFTPPAWSELAANFGDMVLHSNHIEGTLAGETLAMNLSEFNLPISSF